MAVEGAGDANTRVREVRSIAPGFVGIGADAKKQKAGLNLIASLALLPENRKALLDTPHVRAHPRARSR